MLVELERDAPQDQKQPVAINPDHIWNVMPGVQRGLAGGPTTMITFINCQSLTILGDLRAVLDQLAGKH